MIENNNMQKLYDILADAWNLEDGKGSYVINQTPESALKLREILDNLVADYGVQERSSG